MSKLSIIIPCYNEEEGIPQLVEELKKSEKLLQLYTLEYVFVDDGSTDKTYSLLKKIYKKKKNVKIIQHTVNKNLGESLRTGIKHATGDYIAFIDSDCTYNPSEIKNMMDLFDANTDVVIGSPYHPDGKVLNVPEYRLFLSKAVTKVYQILTKSNIHTFTGIFRVYRKEVLKNTPFNSYNFIALAELAIYPLKKGYHIKEYPTTLKSRVFGASKMKIFKVIKEHLAFIVKVSLGRY